MYSNEKHLALASIQIYTSTRYINISDKIKPGKSAAGCCVKYWKTTDQKPFCCCCCATRDGRGSRYVLWRFFPVLFFVAYISSRVVAYYTILKSSCIALQWRAPSSNSPTLCTSFDQVLVTIVRDGASALNLKVVLGDEAAEGGGDKSGPGFLPLPPPPP